MNTPLFLILFASLVLSITPQNGDRLFVTDRADEITLFEEVLEYETIGLLAHDNRAGAHFYDLELQSVISLDFGAYSIIYQIVEKKRLESDWIDSKGIQRSSREKEIYKEMYSHGGVIFQTCAPDGWLFLRAEQLAEVSCSNCTEQRFY